jgi:hypothetical protein
LEVDRLECPQCDSESGSGTHRGRSEGERPERSGRATDRTKRGSETERGRVAVRKRERERVRGGQRQRRRQRERDRVCACEREGENGKQE